MLREIQRVRQTLIQARVLIRQFQILLRQFLDPLILLDYGV